MPHATAVPPSYRLFERGQITLHNRLIQVQLGMAILSYDGQPAGHVAALVTHPENGRCTHLLITTLPPARRYRLVPVEVISRIEQQQVWLHLARPAIEHLPAR